MMALIKSGNAGVEAVRSVAEHALSRSASLLPIHHAAPLPGLWSNVAGLYLEAGLVHDSAVQPAIRSVEKTNIGLVA